MSTYDKEGRKKIYAKLFSHIDKSFGGSGYVNEDMHDSIDWLGDHMEREYNSWRKYGIMNDEGKETKRWYFQKDSSDWEASVRYIINQLYHFCPSRNDIEIPTKYFYNSLPDPPDDSLIHQFPYDQIDQPPQVISETLMQRILNLAEVTHKEWVIYTVDTDSFLTLDSKEKREYEYQRAIDNCNK